MVEEGKCNVCQKPAAHKCGGCHCVYYCNKNHQREGWKKHKQSCRPFKVCHDNVLGRHLVATKPIKQGEVILKEMPLVWGPSQITIPVCLGCAKPIDERTSKPCPKCGWPMCSEMCSNSPSHIPECSYTMKRGEKVSIRHFNIIHPSYQCITALRCLHQKQFLPEVWERFDGLESHCEERKATQKYQMEKKTVVEFIRRFFKLECFDDEELLRICGIIMVNGHEVPLNNPPHVAVYETASLLEHNCSPNCCKSFTSKGSIIISAGKQISKYDHLSICYTDPLWGTPNRRHHLHESKFFWCECERCSDPTEFGTNFSAMRCQSSGCDGVLLPKSFCGDVKAHSTSHWFCNKCDHVQKTDHINELLDTIGRRLESMPKGDVRACKKFLEENARYLPRNHFYMTDVKFALCQIIGQEDSGHLASVSNEDLDLKATTCQEVLDLVEVLVPSQRRISGLFMFELQAVRAEIGRRKAENGTISPKELEETFLDGEKLLLQIIEYLKYEPQEITEGKMYEQAKINLKQVRSLIQTIQKGKNNALK